MLSPSRLRARLTRRDLMRVGGVSAVALLVGCTADEPARPAPTRPAAPDPDVAVLVSALEAERALVSAYRGPVQVGAEGVPVVRELRAHHRDHLAELEAAITALGGSVPPDGGSGPPSPTDPSPSTAPTQLRASAVPSGSPRSTPAQLRTAEREHGRAASTGVARATDGDVALLLAEIGASHAQHAVALGGLR